MLTAIVFVSLSVVPIRAGVAEEFSAAEAGLRNLGEEYDQLWKAAYSAADEQPEYSAQMSDERYLELYYEITSKPSPDSQVLPRLLEFAKANSETPFAFDALAFSIWRGGPATGELHGTAWRIKEEALQLVRDHHMDAPRVTHVFDLVAGSIPSERTEKFLRYGFERGQDRRTRAAAGLALAKYLHNRDRYERRSSKLMDQIELKNSLALQGF